MSVHQNGELPVHLSRISQTCCLWLQETLRNPTRVEEMPHSSHQQRRGSHWVCWRHSRRAAGPSRTHPSTCWGGDWTSPHWKVTPHHHFLPLRTRNSKENVQPTACWKSNRLMDRINDWFFPSCFHPQSHRSNPSSGRVHRSHGAPAVVFNVVTFYVVEAGVVIETSDGVYGTTERRQCYSPPEKSERLSSISSKNLNGVTYCAPFGIHGGFHHPLVGEWIKHLHIPQMFVTVMAADSIHFTCGRKETPNM